MIIKTIWENLLFGHVLLYRYTSPIRILVCILLSIIALPIDIILSPLEILVLIIFKIINREDD
jgi:hypothetical protein